MSINKISIENIISHVEDIPTLPQVVTRIIELTENPNSTVKDIEEEVLKNQSLTARILRLANSAYYSYPRKISTISQATVLLGFKTIKSITLTASVGGILNKSLSGYALDEHVLLKQSQICAMLSRNIAKQVKFNKVEDAYIAGLLRDIGKLILNYYMTEQYHHIINKIENEKITFLEAEEAILGVNHAEVGSKIAEKWNLPEELVEAIAYHHTPEKAIINKEITSIVHIADAIVMMLGIGLGVDGLAYYLSPYALSTLGLSELNIDQFIADTNELIVDSDTFM